MDWENRERTAVQRYGSSRILRSFSPLYPPQAEENPSAIAGLETDNGDGLLAEIAYS